jgi:hypothetical protein
MLFLRMHIQPIKILSKISNLCDYQSYSKAKVKIGNLSRNGKSRTMEAKKADDHDNERGCSKNDERRSPIIFSKALHR